MELGAFSISLAVKDIEASKAFYEKFGFTFFGGDPSQNWLILNVEPRAAADNMPRIARTVRTLTTDECGRVIARLVERPRGELLHPFMLRFYGWTHRMAPALVLWLLRATGARRG